MYVIDLLTYRLRGNTVEWLRIQTLEPGLNATESHMLG